MENVPSAVGGAPGDLFPDRDDRPSIGCELGGVHDDLGALDGDPVGLLGVVRAILQGPLHSRALSGALGGGDVTEGDGGEESQKDEAQPPETKPSRVKPPVHASVLYAARQVCQEAHRFRLCDELVQASSGGEASNLFASRT